MGGTSSQAWTKRLSGDFLFASFTGFRCQERWFVGTSCLVLQANCLKKRCPKAISSPQLSKQRIDTRSPTRMFFRMFFGGLKAFETN